VSVELVCPTCGAVSDAEDGPREWVCIRCDVALLERTPSFINWDQAVTDIDGVGRYSQLLPVAKSELLESSSPALRPIRMPQLSAHLGVREVWILPQTHNYTGTFKDNEAVILAAKASEWGLQNVAMHSSGNTARAYQYYMDRVGVDCQAFVPEASVYKCPVRRLGGSGIDSVDGNMQDCADASESFTKETGATKLAPSSWKIEGKTPLGFAIAEHLPQTTVVGATVASGYGPLGIQRAFDRSLRAGLPAPSDSRFLMAQASDAAALTLAVASGGPVDMSSSAAPIDAFEPTLQSTNPSKNLPRVRDLVHRTHSSLVAVSPAEVMDSAQYFLDACVDEGVPLDLALEKSAFICWSGVVSAARSGTLRSDDCLVIVVSGSGPGIATAHGES
jgi:threonine synthase